MLNKDKASKKAQANNTAPVGPEVEDLSPAIAKGKGKRALNGNQEITRKKDKKSKNKEQSQILFQTQEQKKVALDKADAVKQFTELNRLQKIIQINSTLEEKADSAFADQREAEWRNFQAQLSSLSELSQNKGWGGGEPDHHMHADEKGTLNLRNFVDQLKKFFFGRLYKYNHVLLDNQGVTKMIYHAFLFIEFLQILFFCFYKFTFINEFVEPSPDSEASLTDTSANTSSTGGSDYYGQDLSAIETPTIAVDERKQTSSLLLGLEGALSASNQFRIDTQIKWANFHLLALEMKEATYFILIYAVMVGLFLTLVCSIYLGANRLFKNSLCDEIKDGTQLMVKVLSFLMALFMFLFQIPFQSILLQGFLCGEDMNADDYAVKGIVCQGSMNQTLFVVSALVIPIYLVFLYLQNYLYNSSNLESDLPWGSLDTELANMRSLWKLYLCAAFMFDKAGDYSAFTRLAASGFGLVISIKRLTSPVVIIESVFLANSFYDLCSSQLFFHVAITQLSGLTLSVNKTISTFSMTVFLSIAGIIISSRFRGMGVLSQHLLTGDEPTAKTPIAVTQTIYQILKLIRSTKLKSNAIINGVLFKHFEDCVSRECRCEELFLQFEMNVHRGEFIYEIGEAYEQRILRYKYLRDSFGENGDKNQELDQEQKFKMSMDHYDMADQDIDFGQSNGKPVVPKLPQFKGDSVTSPSGFDPSFPAKSDDYLQASGREVQAINASKFKSEATKLEHTQFHQPVNFHFQGNLVGSNASGTQMLHQIVNSHQKPSHQEFNETLEPQSRPPLAAVPSPTGGQKLVTPHSQVSQARGRFIPGSVIEEITSIGSGAGHLFDQNSFSGVGLAQNMNGANAGNTSALSNLLAGSVVSGGSGMKNEQLDDAQIQSQLNILRYRFLALYIDLAIKKFPKNVELRIHCSNVHCFKLDNEFKATFELMKCEKGLVLDFSSKFCIFRRRLLIEKNLFTRNQSYVSEGNFFNSSTVFEFEKLYQRFIRFSYFAASSATTFWRELLKRSIDSQVLIDKGSEISRIHTKVKEIANHIMVISPNDVKFLLSYAAFLWQIVHIEQEAQFAFDRAFQIFQRFPNTDSQLDNQIGTSQGSYKSDKGHFEENSAQGIVIVALSSEQFGQILHVSDEIQRVLGYKRQVLIGKNISCITPAPVEVVHDRFLTNFLETGKSTMINKARFLYAVSYDGYLRPVKIMLQLYPQMQDKITLLGFISQIDKIEGVPAPNFNDVPEDIFYNSPHHYLMTDAVGNVSCISEGLEDIGLISQFFMRHNSNFKTVSLDAIMGIEFANVNNIEQLMSEGVVTQIDTSRILEHVNVESIPHEETIEAMNRQGIYNIHIQLKRFVFEGGLSTVDLYRILLLPAHHNADKRTSKILDTDSMNLFVNKNPSRAKGTSGDPQGTPISNDLDDSKLVDNGNSQGSGSLESKFQAINSMSSSASRSSSSSKISYSTVIQEFKSAIGQRNTPWNLKRLNWILIVILFSMLICSSIDYSLKLTYTEYEGMITTLLVHSQSRSIRFVQLCQNLRSLISIPNNLAFGRYADPSLGRVNRFDYIREQVMIQTNELSSLVSYFAKMKGQLSKDNIQDFESQLIKSYRLAADGTIQPGSLHFKQAFDQFLNKVLQLNVTDSSVLKLPMYILKSAPYLTLASEKSNKTTTSLIEQDASYMILNGLRALLVTTHDVEEYLHQVVTQSSKERDLDKFMAIMIVGLFLCSISLGLMISKIANTDRINREILQIFSLLQLNEIHRIYEIVDSYIDTIDTDEFASPPDRVIQYANQDMSQLVSISAQGNNAKDSKRSQLGIKDIQIEPSTTNQNLQNMAITQGGVISQTAAQFHVTNKAIGKTLMQPALLEELKSNTDSSLIMNSNHRIRNPLQRLNNGSERTRKAFYSKMVQKVLRIMKDEEIYQEQIQIEREKHKEEIVLHKMSLTRQAQKIGIGRFGDQKEPSGNEGEEDDEESTRNEEKGKKNHHKKTDAKRKVGFNSKQRLQNKGSIDRQDNKHQSPNKRNARGKVKVEPHSSGAQDMDSSRIRLKQNNADSVNDESNSNLSSSRDHGEFELSMEMTVAQERNKHIADRDAFHQEIELFEIRKEMLMTISQERKRKCWNQVLMIMSFMTIFIGFFIYTYFFHYSELHTLYQIQQHSPSFFKRFETISLQYQFIREKIINQNTNDTQMDFHLPVTAKHTTTADGKPIPIGQYYHDQSMDGETEIQNMKNTNPSYLGPLLKFVGKLDSGAFCDVVFKMNEGEIVTSAAIKSMSTSKLQLILASSYRTEVDNDIPVILAVQVDDNVKLMELRKMGHIFGNPDYDGRTPIHVAARRGNLAAVQLIAETGVNVSHADRWGVTPLSESVPFPKIHDYLLSKGAVLGHARFEFTSQRVTLTDNEYRLFFAAYYNDVTMMDALEYLGWDVNVLDRTKRTPLHIAAAQGSYDAVVRLLAAGANIKYIDARGNDALDDAISANDHRVMSYLIENALVRNQCPLFEDEIFSKGFSSALGIFNRKFEDVEIALQNSKNKTELLTLIGGNITPEQAQTYVTSNALALELLKSGKRNLATGSVSPSIKASVANGTSNETSSTVSTVPSPSSQPTNSSTNTSAPLNTLSATTQRVMRVFFSTQELYLRKVINRQEEVLLETYQVHTQDYIDGAKIVYFIFLVVQIFALVYLRRKFIESLKEEIIHSRGILNLVPERFFKENQQEVEKVIKMISK